MPTRLIVTDIDGTLLNRQGEVTPRVRAALTELERRGVAVVLSTARPPRTLRKLYAELGLRTPLVAYNGAMGYDMEAGQVLFHHALARLAAQAVHRVVAEIAPDLSMGLELADQWHVNRIDPPLAARIEAGIVEVAPSVSDLGEVLATTPREISKLYFWAPLEVRAEMEARLRQMGLDREVSVTSSYPGFVEVMAAGVNKGAALRALAAIMGIPADQVLALGDEENDIPALQAAGLGIAMGNASELVKAAAGAVVGANTEDGWAEAVERFVLAG